MAFEFPNPDEFKGNYHLPFFKSIIVNELYEEGHQIIIYTARGMTSFQGDVKRINQELYSLTIKQLKEWGINFHKLIMGKAHYDLLVDDKVINSLRVTSINDIKEIIK